MSKIQMMIMRKIIQNMEMSMEKFMDIIFLILVKNYLDIALM